MPSIVSVTPETVGPGESVVIDGSGFASSGRVEIDGIAVPADSIRMWRNDRVSFVMPLEFNSGLLRIRTATGTSEPMFLNSATDVPRVAHRSRPSVDRVEPPTASIGEPVAIEGVRFGPRHGRTALSFRSDSDGLVVPATAREVVEWSDGRIILVIPAELTPGTYEIEVNGAVAPRSLTVLEPAASRTFGASSRFAIGLQVSAAGGGAQTRVFLPRIPETAEQPSVQLLRELGDRVDPASGAAWVYAGGPAGEQVTVARTELVSRREVSLSIGDAGSSAVLLDPAFRQAFRPFLRSEPGIPRDAPAVVALRSRDIDLSESPDRIARAAHRATIAALEPLLGGTSDVIVALGGEPADSPAYAALYVALARGSGLPARRHAGVVASDGGTAVPYEWAEVFVPRVGWVPVDPALGDGLLDEDFSRLLEFYDDDLAAASFARLDSRRVTLARDGADAPSWYPLGAIWRTKLLPALDTARVEAPDRAASDSIEVRWEAPTLLAELEAGDALR